jgi:hypothetical protein
MSLIGPGIKFWSWRGAMHVTQSFAFFLVPGYGLYCLNTSEMVRGDIQSQLPKRPDLPMGGNASNRTYKTPAEESLNEMLQKVKRVRLAPALWCPGLF